jgi:predicted DNA-binding protein (UPF0251 family)
MPRPCKKRCCKCSIRASRFVPEAIERISLEEVILNIAEIEALRLSEIEGLSQVEAAKRMMISQSTFSRILQSAIHKIAEAVILGKLISISKDNS